MRISEGHGRPSARRVCTSCDRTVCNRVATGTWGFRHRATPGERSVRPSRHGCSPMRGDASIYRDVTPRRRKSITTSCPTTTGECNPSSRITQRTTAPLEPDCLRACRPVAFNVREKWLRPPRPKELCFRALHVRPGQCVSYSWLSSRCSSSGGVGLAAVLPSIAVDSMEVTEKSCPPQNPLRPRPERAWHSTLIPSFLGSRVANVAQAFGTGLLQHGHS